MPALTEPDFVGLSLFRRLPFLRLLWAFRSAFGPTCTCPHTHTLRSRGRVAGFLLLSKATSAQLLRTQGHADAGGAKALARQEHAARPWGAPPLRGLPLCLPKIPRGPPRSPRLPSFSISSSSPSSCQPACAVKIRFRGRDHGRDCKFVTVVGTVCCKGNCLCVGIVCRRSSKENRRGCGMPGDSGFSCRLRFRWAHFYRTPCRPCAPTRASGSFV